MREIPFRRLVSGPAASGDRIALLSIWFHGHNNGRYAELLPRLERVDACFLRLPDKRVPRGIGFRLFHAVQRPLYGLGLGLAANRYRSLLTLDYAQLAAWPGPAVLDADDPYFTERAIELMLRPSLTAYVVTAERAARRFESLGVEKPWVVIPQGVDLAAATPELRRAFAARRRSGELVVGWMAAHLLTTGDADSEGPLYNIDHLLDLWDEAHARVPATRLWLVGDPSDRVRQRLAGRDDVLLLGRLRRAETLAAISCFDVALYPRTEDTGIRAAKVAEYMGLGVPTVSYDYEVTANLRETGAGVLVPDARAFVEALVSLLTDEAARRSTAERARLAGAALDWDVLARRFEHEVLDRYLPGLAPR